MFMPGETCRNKEEQKNEKKKKAYDFVAFLNLLNLE